MKHLKFDCKKDIWQNSDNRTSSAILLIKTRVLILKANG